MIEAIPKLADRIIQLIKHRQETNRRLFNEHIQPIFDTVQLVFNDFSEIYQKIIADLKSGESSIAGLQAEVDVLLKKHWSKRWDLTHYAEHLSKRPKSRDKVDDFITAISEIIFNAEMNFRRSGGLSCALSSLRIEEIKSRENEIDFPSKNHIETIEKEYDQMCKSWLRVSNCYHDLRVLCLE